MELLPTRRFLAHCVRCAYLVSARRIATIQDALSDHVAVVHPDFVCRPVIDPSVADEPRGEPS